jgi:signal transduction histidine kinase
VRRNAEALPGNPSEVFAQICAEVGTVLGVESTNLTRFEPDGTQTVLAGWSVDGAPVFPVRRGVPLDGHAAMAKVSRQDRPERVDDYSELSGGPPELVRAAGIASTVAAPIKLGSRMWGAIVASSGCPNGLPAGMEDRVAGVAELISDAVADADAREQLAASRARIVAAADAERRRLERNLHDGAQQRLVSLAIALREVDAELDRDVDAAREALAGARLELAEALDELRELARGIHPAVLSDRGLGPALQTLAARTPLPVEVTALPETRLPERVEAAAYFLVAEALTNVVKHAGATCAKVEITQDAGRARIEVRDDGTGGAALAEGSSLRGLRDRLEALGGTLLLDSRDGAGTSVVGEIPSGRSPGPTASAFG